MKRLLISLILLLLVTATIVGTLGVYAKWASINRDIETVYADMVYGPGGGEKAYATRTAHYYYLLEKRETQLYNSPIALVRWITAPRPQYMDFLVGAMIFVVEALLLYCAHQIYRGSKDKFIEEVCEDSQLDCRFANLELRYVYKRNILIATWLASRDLHRAEKALARHREAFEQAEKLRARKRAMRKANKANRQLKVRSTQLKVLS